MRSTSQARFAGTVLLALIPTALRAQGASQEWPQHSRERPQPPFEVAPAQRLPAAPPPGAVILFAGKDLSRWQRSDGSPAGWRVLPDGTMEVVARTGDIQTRDGFGDALLHVEWATPPVTSGGGQTPGNSGVYLMATYEVQVLDSHRNVTYPDGQAGAIYGQFPPRVNVSRAPGEWQSFDIEYRCPRFGATGQLLSPARMTVRHNGVLIHSDVALLGPTSHTVRAPYQAHADALPVLLQDHGQAVRFRNIWLVPLAP